MSQVSMWTGFEANALRMALRLSLRAYAEHLGVGFGTVTSWHKRGATVRPTPDMQAVLDAALARSSPEARQRFETAIRLAAESDVVADSDDRRPLDTEPAAKASATSSVGDDVLLTVVVGGQSVTLPLEIVTAAARSTAAGFPANSTELKTDWPRRHPDASAFAQDERAYELFVRGCGLLGANDRQDIETAQSLLQRAVNRDPHFARAIAARGYTSWRQYFAGWTPRSQALVDALQDVDAALDVDPDSVFAHLTFIRACWDMGWHERALQAGRSIYDRNPDSLDATVAFARALNNAGLAQYALPLVGSVLTVDPTHPAAVKLYVWCHLMVGNYAHAITCSKDSLTRHPADANTRWAVALASQYVSGGNDEAIRIAGEGLAADPGDVTLWVLLGYLYRVNGDNARAIRIWERGLERVQVDVEGGSNPRTRVWLANLHAGAGDVQAAVRCVDELVETHPQNGYVRYRLAHVLAEAGRCDASIGMLEEAVAHGFLSAQLLRRETILALEPLRGMGSFVDVVHALDLNVERCQRTYAAGLPAAALAS